MSAVNKYSGDNGPSAPAGNGQAVVVDIEFTQVSKCIWVGTTGDVSAVMADVANTLVFVGVPVGWLDIRCKKITSANTTADNMVAVY